MTRITNRPYINLVVDRERRVPTQSNRKQKQFSDVNLFPYIVLESTIPNFMEVILQCAYKGF